MTLALLCSGQGRQHAAMFALTGQAPEAEAVFAAAAAALDGEDPRHLVERGAAAMDANRAAQILCCAQALAAHAALGASIGAPVTIAGYSVGELAAWGCAGILSAEATLRLARLRADAMDRASGPNGGLAFVRGLPRDAIDGLCARYGAGVSIVNPRDTYVLGGARPRLEMLCEAARSEGATRVGLLAVHVASHTARLAPASAAVRAALDAEALACPRPGTQVLSGVDGQRVLDLKIGAGKLAAQIAQTVAWADCLDACVESGATVFLELGPGRSLADMVVDAYPNVQARGIDEFRSLDGVRSWLGRAGGRNDDRGGDRRAGPM